MRNKLTLLALLLFIITSMSFAQVTNLTHAGTGPYATIQLAIDNAATLPGDVIVVSAGTYNESITITKDGLQLRGAQYGVHANTGSRTNPAAESIINGTSPVAIMANNVVIDGFTIQGSDASSFISGIWCNPGYSGKNGGFHILNNIIQNNVSGIGVGNDGTIQAIVQYNLIQNNNNAGPGSGNGFSAAFALNNVIIDNNTFDNNQFYLNGFESTGITGVQTITVSNNEIKNVTSSGLFIMGSLGITITGNNIHNNTGSSISIGGGGDNLTITDNMLKNNSEWGIIISDDWAVGTNANITVHTNSIETNSSGGVSVTSGTYTGTLNAIGNWWGNESGPHHAITNPSGTGNSVSDNVNYSPWLGQSDISHSTPWTLTGNGGDLDDIMPLLLDGDTLILNPGTYNSFTVTQSITITGTPYSLIGHASPAITIAANNVTITNLAFDYVGLDYAIEISVGVTGTIINYCNFNVTNAINNLSAFAVSAEYNYWGFGGNINGPTIASNVGGTGGLITDAAGTVDYNPFVGKGNVTPAQSAVSVAVNTFPINWGWLNFFGTNFHFKLDHLGIPGGDVNQLVATNSYNVSSPLFYSTTYHWYVRSDIDPLSIWIGPFSFTTTALPSPILTIPASTLTGVTILPYFDWTWGGEGTVTYDLKIYDSDNSTLLKTVSDISATAYQLLETDYVLLNNHTYYWTVTVKQDNGLTINSTTSAASSFKTAVAAAAILSNPGSSAIAYTYAPVLFSWYLNTPVGSLTFKLQYVKNSASGGTPDAIDWANGGITTTIDCAGDLSRNTESLFPGTKYWWRVITYRGTEIISYSGQQYFTTAGGAANAASIPSWPIGGAIVYTNTPTLSWYTNIGDLTDITFDIEISKSDLVTPVSLNNETGLTNLYYNVDPALDPGYTYYWRVITYGNGDVPSTTSAWNSFNTNGTGKVIQPIASYPSSGVTVYEQSPTFSWYLSSATSGITYKVYIDGIFDNSVVDQLYFTTSQTLTPGSHTWYVKATNGTIAQDLSSSTITFTVAGGITVGLPIASWPIGNATIYTTTPTLSWYVNGSTLALSYYKVAFSTTQADVANFNVSIPANTTSGGYYIKGNLSTADINTRSVDLSATPLGYGQTYYWAVASYDPVNPTHYSTASQGSFTISGTTGSIVPVVSNPIGGATIYSTSATLSWYVNGSTVGIQSYKVEYSRASGFVAGSDSYGAITTTTTGITNQFLNITSLVQGATYYWRVYSYNGTAYSAASSPIGTFVVAPSASSSVIVPLVGSPINGVGITTTSPMLSWAIPTQVSSPLNYELQYSKKQDMSNATTVSGIKSPSKIVSGLAPNQEYYWRVRSTNDKGQASSYSEVGKFIVGAVTAVEEKEIIPTQFELSQNYPNPFNPTTKISYALPQNSYVSIKVYDVLGREVKSLVNNEMGAGNHSVDWNGDDNNGNKVVSGIYLYKITASSFVSVKKMILIK